MPTKREEDLAKCIFNLKTNEQIDELPKINQREVVVFGELGKEVDDENSENAYCKITNVDNTQRFYVKKGFDGKLLNPKGLYEEMEHKRKRKEEYRRWKYKEVPEKSFNYYMSYLQTGNVAYLLNAEREAF